MHICFTHFYIKSHTDFSNSVPTIYLSSSIHFSSMTKFLILFTLNGNKLFIIDVYTFFKFQRVNSFTLVCRLCGKSGYLHFVHKMSTSYRWIRPCGKISWQQFKVDTTI